MILLLIITESGPMVIPGLLEKAPMRMAGISQFTNTLSITDGTPYLEITIDGCIFQTIDQGNRRPEGLVAAHPAGYKNNC